MSRVRRAAFSSVGLRVAWQSFRTGDRDPRVSGPDRFSIERFLVMKVPRWNWPNLLNRLPPFSLKPIPEVRGLLGSSRRDAHYRKRRSRDCRFRIGPTIVVT